MLTILPYRCAIIVGSTCLVGRNVPLSSPEDVLPVLRLYLPHRLSTGPVTPAALIRM